MITKDDLHNMVKREGFVEVFWRYLNEERRARPKLTREIAFEELDSLYCDEYDCHQFPSYDAFRKHLTRARR